MLLCWVCHVSGCIRGILGRWGLLEIRQEQGFEVGLPFTIQQVEASIQGPASTQSRKEESQNKQLFIICTMWNQCRLLQP